MAKSKTTTTTKRSPRTKRTTTTTRTTTRTKPSKKKPVARHLKRTKGRASSPKPTKKRTSKRSIEKDAVEEEDVEPSKEVVLSCIVLPNRHENRLKRRIEFNKKKQAKEPGMPPECEKEDEQLDAIVANVNNRSAISNVQRIRYDNEKYKKLVNVFNGKSGEGFCYKFGVIRKGGKPFMDKMRDCSHAFLLEMVYKCVQLCVTKNKAIISSEMVSNVAQTFGITPIF